MATNTNYDTAGVHLLVFVVLCNLTLNNIGLLERYKILFLGFSVWSFVLV